MLPEEGNAAEIRALNEESLALFRELGDRWALTLPLGSLGVAGDESRRLAYLEEMLSIVQEFGDQQGIAWTLIALGGLALQAGDYRRAAQLYGQSLDLYRQSNNRGVMIGIALLGLGYVNLQQRDARQALAHFAEALAVFQAVDDKDYTATTLAALGDAAKELGDDGKAQAYYRESLRRSQVLDNPPRVIGLLNAMAELKLDQGDVQHAVTLAGAAEAFQETIQRTPINLNLLPAPHLKCDRPAMQRRSQLDEGTFNATWAEGRALTLGKAIALALGDE